MKNFKDNFINSLIPNSKYYKTIVKKKFVDSLFLFSTTLFLLTLIFNFLFITKINSNFGFKNIKKLFSVFDNLPKELIVNIENGFLSTNQEKPVLLWYKDNNKNKLLAVIDETAQVEKINTYNSTALLTSNRIVIKNNQDNSFIQIPYSNENIKITSNSIEKFQKIFLNIFPIIVVLFFLYFLFIAPFLLFIFLLFFLSIYSFIAYIIFKNKKLTYKKTYQIALHATLLPLAIFYLLMIFSGLSFTLFSFPLFAFLSFVFILISVYDAK